MEKMEPIDSDLGNNLKTIEDVKQWLNHPSNQIDTKLFIIKWVGNVPYLSKYQVKYFNEDPVLAEVVLIEHTRRKRGLRSFEEITEE